MAFRIPIAITVLTLSSGALFAQQIQATWTPSIDRWWYPFNFSNGAEQNAPTFAALGQAGFDDRDSDLVLAFNTAGQVPAGRGAGKYRVVSAQVRLTTSNPPRFAYDPTFDSVCTITTPNQCTDDPGKPVELFAAGFRNGLSSLTLTENAPFSTTPSFPPQESIRSVFPSRVGSDGRVLANGDVSNHVTEGVEAQPLAIALTDAVSPGDLVPTGTVMTFTFDVSQPATALYLARGLDEGRIVLVASSLHSAAGGPGGGTGDPQYPSFYTKENPTAIALGLVGGLDITVELTSIIDFNNDGLFPDTQDIDDFLAAFAGAPCDPCSSIDINGDGLFPDTADIDVFLCLFAGGVCTP
jgi:hypothetical protein